MIVAIPTSREVATPTISPEASVVLKAVALPVLATPDSAAIPLNLRMNDVDRESEQADELLRRGSSGTTDR